MTVFSYAQFPTITYISPNFPSLHNPPSLPRKKIFYPFPLRRIYLPFRKSEGLANNHQSITV